MSYRGTCIPFPGLMAGYIGTSPLGLLVKSFSQQNILTEVLWRVTHPPTGGDLVIELNTLEDGTGTATQVTITDGTTYAISTGLATSVGALYQIVRSEGGTATAMNLSGEYTLNTVTGVTDYFTTLDKVKYDAKIGGTDPNRDIVLNNLIAGVTSRMQDWMNRSIVQGTALSEKIDGSGEDAIFTEHFPILEITTITEDGTALVENTDFECIGSDLETGRIVRLSGVSGDPIPWSAGRRNIVVTYDYGYVTIPDALVEAATALVVSKFNETAQSGKGWRGIESKGGEPISATSFDKEIWTRETIPAMQRYRRLQA